MTTEQKAKAYDEALERAKKQLKDARVFDYKEEQIAYDIRFTTYAIFPELKESEDERIRKELWEYFHELELGSDRDFSPSLTIDDILAWLEKQKPAEWGEEDESMLNLIITDVRLGWQKCGVGTDEWNARSKAVRWLKSLPERFNLQPQAEQYKQCIYGETPSAERCAICFARCDIRVREDGQKTAAKLTGWVARDRDGGIWVYDLCPKKDSERGLWRGSNSMILDQKSFPDLKWENEPMEVEIIIRKK